MTAMVIVAIVIIAAVLFLKNKDNAREKQSTNPTPQPTKSQRHRHNNVQNSSVKPNNSIAQPPENRGSKLHDISTQTIRVHNSITQQTPIVEEPPKLNYSKEIFVEYDALAKESTSLYYPYVKVPNKNTLIKYPIKGKNSRKGIIEGSFVRDFLNKYFLGLIYDNLSIFIGNTPFEPDISFIDTSHRNIFIDIEIDEPYDGITRNPIHYVESEKSIDESRNKDFADRGWIVIRFSERQIKENPMGCCRFIYEIYNHITGISITDLLLIPPVPKENMWTKAEAEQMAKNKDRERYLGISQFQQSDTPRQYLITDYSEGKKIEERLRNITTSKTYPAKPTAQKYINAKPLINISSTVGGSSIIGTTATAKPQAPQTPTTNNTPRISTQTTNQPSTPASRPYAYE